MLSKNLRGSDAEHTDRGGDAGRLAGRARGFRYPVKLFRLPPRPSACTTRMLAAPPLNIADGEPLPLRHRAYGLRRCDVSRLAAAYLRPARPSVTRQIDFARAAFAAGVPVRGSCWGLQLAVAALGGSVRRNPRGRELPIARAITVTEAGRQPAPRIPSRRFRRALLAPRRDRNAAAELAGPGGERGLRDTGNSRCKPRLGSVFTALSITPSTLWPSRPPLSSCEPPSSSKRALAGKPSEIVAIAADYRALASRACPPRPDLALRGSQRDHGSPSPDHRDRQLAADRRHTAPVLNFAAPTRPQSAGPTNLRAGAQVCGAACRSPRQVVRDQSWMIGQLSSRTQSPKLK